MRIFASFLGIACIAIILGCGGLGTKPTGESNGNGGSATVAQFAGQADTFSATSPDISLRWLAAEYDRISRHDTKGNAFANKSKEELFDAFVKPLHGKSISWAMELSGVSRTGNVISLKPLNRLPSAVIPIDQQGIYYSMSVTPAQEGQFQFAGFSPKPPIDWLNTAQTGDKVVLSGTIQRAMMGEGSQVDMFNVNGKTKDVFRKVVSWKFILMDGRVEPVSR